MKEYILKLVSGFHEHTELTLELIEKEKLPIGTEYDVCKERYIFSDHPYSAELIGEDVEIIDNIIFLVNGFPVSQTIHNGHIEFNDTRFPRSMIFMDNFGYVQISIIFSVAGKQTEIFSRYVSVLVRKGLISESVQRMASFVYIHHETFLRGKRMSSRSAKGLKKDSPQILNSKINILYRVLKTYESNFPFFKTNGKFHVQMESGLVDIEKAQYFDNATIHNIVRSPSYLVPAIQYGGIRYQKTNYVPRKVLSKTSRINYDIYENRVIVSFLISLKTEVSSLISEIEKRIEGVPSKKEIINGYFASACFICDATRRQMTECLSQLKRGLIKLSELYILYQNLLQVPLISIKQPPKPSAIFLSIHHYRAVYDRIVEWFQYGIYDFAREDFMLPFIQMHKLYEYYVLTKLCYYLENEGFELERCESYSYKEHCASSLYENINTFYFIKEELRITVYYEPTINGKRNLGDNGIGLYRNTSIPFPKQWQIDRFLSEEIDNVPQSAMYCPDYVIKIQHQNYADYIIMDAKFSRLETVKGVYFPCLAYKYLFSLSPIRQADHILGLCLVNGKAVETNDAAHNVYDLADESSQIQPFATILTLTENLVENEEQHRQLFKSIFHI